MHAKFIEKKNKKKFKNTIDILRDMWYNDNVKGESPYDKKYFI